MHFKAGADDKNGAGAWQMQVSAAFLMMWRGYEGVKEERFEPCNLSHCAERGKVGRSTKILQHFRVLEKSEQIVMENKKIK